MAHAAAKTPSPAAPRWWATSTPTTKPLVRSSTLETASTALFVRTRRALLPARLAIGWIVRTHRPLGASPVRPRVHVANDGSTPPLMLGWIPPTAPLTRSREARKE